jgi:hypothetical protein
MGSGASITAGFALFFAIVAIILVGVLFFMERYRPTIVTYAIQAGTATPTDVFAPDTNIYIANTALTTQASITINPASTFTTGRSIYIKNASSHNVTLIAGAGFAITTGEINNGMVVTPGQTAWLLFTANNVALRLM